MPTVTLNTFLSNLTKSNLLDDKQLQIVNSDAESAGDSLDPKQLSQKLVKDGLITRWQAGMLLAGRSAFFLGKYKLLQELGRGGMGAVFKAEQQPLGRIVAIKVMAKNMMKDKTAVARFQREIQAAAALQHPNIVAAIDADNVQNTHFLVMEFVEGEDLSDISKRENILPIGTACDYIRQAALGLQHAHERGMAHRDIKPANLLLTWRTPTEPVVKILDMGLARFTSEAGEDGGLTQTGQIMGTPDYIAPEQAKDTKHADIRSDIFSLGCSLFRFLTGQLPFKGNNVMEKLMARATDHPPPLRSVFPDAPVELEAIVTKMLARNPDERYQTPAELAEALLPYSTTSDSSSTEHSQPVVPVSELNASPTTSAASMPVDAGMGQFLQDLSNEADDEIAPAQTIKSISDTDLDGDREVSAESPEEGATMMTQAGAKLQHQLEQRKAADRNRLMIVLASVAVSVALIAGVIVWQNMGKTMLIVDWPIDERQGAKLKVDGHSVKLSKKAQLNFPGDPGERTVELNRKGYQSISEQLVFARGETQTFRPKWKPTLSTTRSNEWRQLKTEIQSTLSKFSDQRPTWSDDSITALMRKLQSFKKKWVGKIESYETQSLLARLPGPFDELVVDELPETDPPLDKSVPLVQVLGAQDLRLAHWSRVSSVKFTPGSKFLISANVGTIKIWDTEKGQLQKTLLSSQKFHKVAVSSDGKYLAAAGDGVQLWNLANFKKLPNRLNHKGALYSLAFSPDGKILATVGGFGTTKLWETSSWRELRTLPGTVRLNHVAFSPDGKLLATGGHEKIVKIWDIESGKIINSFKAHKDWIVSLAFSADGQQLVSSASNDRTILWDLESGEEVATTNDIGRLLFSRDGKSLAGTVHNATVVLDPKTLKQRYVIKHGGYSLDISHDSHRIATGSFEGTVRLWNLETGESIINVPEPSGSVTALQVSNDGRLIASGDLEGHIRIYGVPSGQQVHDISAHSSIVSSLSFSPTRQQFLSVDGVGFAILWNAVTGERVRTSPEKTLLGVSAFRPDGKVVAVGGQEGNVILWNTETGAILKTLEQGAALQSLNFSPNGKLLATGSGDHVVKLWDVETGQEVQEPREVEYYVHSLVFTPDRKNLVAASRTVWFWDVNSGTRTRTIPRELYSMAFSPDGNFIVATTGFPPSKVRLFDAKTGQIDREFALTPLGGRIQKVVFTPDGRHLVTANGNGTIYVLRLKEWSANITIE